MLSLTRIFLHHWHRYYAATIDVDGGLCLTGPDEADAAAVLDALQLALLGDPTKVRFAASRYGFSYDVDAYARGRITEDKWQRPGNTVSYVIVEFTNTLTNGKTTHGLCIETGPRLPIEMTWFSLAEGLNPATFVTKGRPLPRIELKPLLRNWRGARYFEKALDYQTDLLTVLGGLEESCFDLFQRALRYQPVRRVEDFVFNWLLDEAPLDLSLLRRMRDRLAQLYADLERTEKQLTALQPIVKGQAEARQFASLRDGQTIIIAMLRSHAAQRQVGALEAQIANLQTQITALQTQLNQQKVLIGETEAQLRDAERREYEDGLAHRKSILEWQNRYATQQADQIRQRWARLARQLRAAGDGLRPLLDGSHLAPDERTALQEFLSVLDAATDLNLVGRGEPPPPALAAALNGVIPTLLAARNRLSADRTHAADQLMEWERLAKLAAERLTHLNTQLPEQPAIPGHIGRMQDLLTPVIGKKPPLLFEFIEVSDPRWQNAVEAALGSARFNAIVSATWYNAAVSTLNKARAPQNLRDANVHDPTQLYNRPAQPGSLAEKVTTIYPDLRAYLDTILGDIICVETPAELSEHRRAITPTGVYHSSRQTITFAFEDYQPVVIGKTAAKVYSDMRQKQAAALQTQITNLQTSVKNQQGVINSLDTALGQLAYAHTLTALSELLNAPLDERTARAEASGYEAELRALELTPLADLKSKADGLRVTLAAQNQTHGEQLYQLVSLETQLSGLQAQLSAARMALDESKVAATATRSQFPNVTAAAEEALPPHLTPADLSGEIKLVEQKEKDFDKKYRDERLRVIEALAAFNTLYQLAPWPGDPDDGRYTEAAHRFTTTELPRLKRDIANAESELDDELRDHILRPLRERLVAARRTFGQINESLATLNSPYRLSVEPVADLKDFYAFIVEGLAEASTGEGHEASDAILAQLYDHLTSHADPRLSDYRRYLQYAMEIHTSEGVTRFTTADGEPQLAFYSVIAASFAHLYRVRTDLGTPTGRPCIRLILFGSAFGRIEPELIAPVLNLFKRLNLQVVASTPLERSDYLIAGLPTVIVLTPVKETILPEPYRNYNALGNVALTP